MERRALTVENILNASFDTIQFQGKFKDSFGQPSIRDDVWLIYGNSGNGKTRFALQLAKELCSHEKVLYISLEEGLAPSFKRAVKQIGMQEVGTQFQFLPRENYKGLTKRLKRRRQAGIIMIDSLQYFDINKKGYLKLRDEFPNKLFIFISHADGKRPAGRLADFVQYDAGVKIWIEGYKAFPMSRYGGNEPYTIWEEGASKYWTEKEEE